MSKSKTSMLLATAAVAVASFGPASVAQAGVSAPQKHPEIIGVLKHPEIIGVLKHPEIIGVLKHPDGHRVPQLASS